MANSLHFVKDKALVLRNVLQRLKPNGRFLLVEYDTHRGTPWVPHPVSFESWKRLAPTIGLTEPGMIATYPSRWSNQMYPAVSELVR